MRITIPALAAVAAALLTVVPAANATGTYNVVACDAAGGPNRSWTQASVAGTTFSSFQRCPAVGSDDGFGVKAAGAMLRAPQLASAWWRFDAPTGTSIESLDWAGHYGAASAGWASRIESSRGQVAGCVSSAASCLKRFTSGARPEHRQVGGAAWLRVGSVCLAASGCRTGDGKGTSFAEAALSYAVVTVADPDSPTLSISGSGWSAGWSKPGGAIDVTASDASGIQSIALSVDGDRSSVKSLFCDYTLPRPCADRSASFRLPAGLSDGRHAVEVTAVDAAGNVTAKRLDLGVDGHAPSAGAAPAVVGGESWRSSGRFQLQWTLPEPDGSAPVAASLLSVCPVELKAVQCLQTVRVPLSPGQAQSSTVDLPAEGAWQARVAFEDSAGNVDPSAAGPAASLRWDTSEPGPGQIDLPSGWITGERARSLTASVHLADGVEAPPSGIAGWAISASGSPGVVADLIGPSVLYAVDGLAEGVTELSARAISGSGIASKSVAKGVIRIDSTPPTVEPVLQPPTGWLRSGFTVTAVGSDQSNLSGIGGGAEGQGGVRISVDGQEVAASSGATASYEVSGDADHHVELEATDAAGNRSGRRSLEVKIDSTAPERVAFLPQDEADPRVLRVDATDSLSGIASVRVRMRPISGGEWVDLPVEQVQGRFQATVDEAVLARGLWELQATAVDLAGNEAVSGRTLSGDPALIALPLRRTSRIDASMSPAAGGTAAAVGGVVVLRNGAAATVSGRLLDSEGEPISNGVISAGAQAITAGAQWADLGVARSDRTGAFRLLVPAGPSRRIRLVFEGDRRNLSSATAMEVRVPSATTLGVNPSLVKVGANALFSGRLSGGWIPSGGKLVVVQAMVPRRGWQTFAVTRAGSDGAWSARYRFRATVGRVAYSIRAVVPAEASYPFATSVSPVIRVTAVG